MDGGQRLRGCGRDQGQSELETDPSAPAMRLALRKCDSARYIAGVVMLVLVESSHARLAREARWFHANSSRAWLDSTWPFFSALSPTPDTSPGSCTASATG
ncbi:hypothetical protein C1922_13930 [Stenotrophomonas sp. ZAC14D2_NAIMI4_7]|nr:hypothetical protein C1922_13930 [Stenotrophomonas sp. ZAC14D2_NAIMI4_7]